MKLRKTVGGGHPQPKKFFQLNHRLTMCNPCEVAQGDRNYLPKSGLVISTSPLFVIEGGN